MKAAARRRLLAALRRERLLLVFGAVALLLGVVDPAPPLRWLQWLALPTLLGLLALLVCIEGIRASGAVQRAAQALAGHAHSQRTLALMLVGGAALLAMVLTNDVSLFLLVPLTLALGRGSQLPTRRVVILEALAVNAGSTLSPFGNPQNLLLWRYSGLSMPQFAWRMLPSAATMLCLLLLTVWLLVPARPLRVAAVAAPPGVPMLRRRLAAASSLALLGVLALLQAARPALAALFVLAMYLAAWREVLRRVDWGLLATLGAMFVGLGHLGHWAPLQQALGRLDWHAPGVVYLGGVALSQLLSNVPATVLLWPQVGRATALAVAVNVGGFGFALGSLANLIALRLEGRGNLAEFHRISLPFLLVCAPLVWLVQRFVA